jgi:hypothetical protein
MKATLFVPGQQPEPLRTDAWADTRPGHADEWDLLRTSTLLKCHPSNIEVLDEGETFTVLAPANAADYDDASENPLATEALAVLNGYHLTEPLYGPILIIEAE